MAAPVDGDLEAPVLGHAPLGDVELRHDLDARDHLLGYFIAGDRGHLHQHAVDAVAHHQPIGQGFEVHVAGARAQGVVERRVHQLDDRAGILADRSQRQVVDDAADGLAGAAAGHCGIEGAQRLFVAADVAGYLRARGQHPLQGLGHAHLEPAAGIGVKGVGDHRQQLVGAARHQAAAPRRLGRRQQVEGRFEPRQLRARQDAVVERAPQRGRELHRPEAGMLLEIVQRRATTSLVGCDGRRQQRLVETEDLRAVERCIHLMLPASSKIGKYISTTITPMMMPIRLISAGSIRRVTSPTQRDSSSS